MTAGAYRHCAIVNNTLYANDRKQTGSGEFQVQYYATNNVFKDNIVYAAASQDLFFNNYTHSEANPVDVDYNVYYSTDAADAQWIWNGKTYTGFAKYQSGAGKDAHSSFANPQFLNLTTPDLDIASGSPAVNTGVVLGSSVNGTVDFAGSPRTVNGLINIGAHQQ